jgi:hypothetical protein
MAEKVKRRTLDQQLDLALADREKMEERIKDLRSRQRTRDDKARTHRLCKRGGTIEKLHPRLAKLDDEQFDMFVELVLKTDHTKGVLDEISPPEPEKTEDSTDAEQGGEPSAQKPAEAAAQPSTPAAPKPAQLPNNGGTGGNAQGGNSNPQNGGNHAPRPANTQQNGNGSGNAQGGNSTPRTS